MGFWDAVKETADDVGDFFGNLGDDVSDAGHAFLPGLYAVGKGIGNDVARATGLGGGSSYQTDDILKGIGALYRDNYDELARGDFAGFGREVFNHPLDYVLDAAALAAIPFTMGGSVAVRSAALAKAAGASSTAARIARTAGHVPTTPASLAAYAKAGGNVGKYASRPFVPTTRVLTHATGLKSLPSIAHPSPFVRGRQRFITDPLRTRIPTATPLVGMHRVGHDIALQSSRVAQQNTDQYLEPFARHMRKLNDAEAKAWFLRQQAVEPHKFIDMLSEEYAKNPMPDTAEMTKASIKAFSDPKIVKAWNSRKVKQAVELGSRLSAKNESLILDMARRQGRSDAEVAQLAKTLEEGRLRGVRFAEGARHMDGEPDVYQPRPDNAKHARELARLQRAQEKQAADLDSRAESIRNDASRADVDEVARLRRENLRAINAATRRAAQLERPRRKVKERPRTEAEARADLRAALERVKRSGWKGKKGELRDILKAVLAMDSKQVYTYNRRQRMDVKKGRKGEREPYDWRAHADSVLMRFAEIYARELDDVVDLGTPEAGTLMVARPDGIARFFEDAGLSKDDARAIVEAAEDAAFLREAVFDADIRFGADTSDIDFGTIREIIEDSKTTVAKRTAAARELRRLAWKIAERDPDIADSVSGKKLRAAAARMERGAQRKREHVSKRMRREQALADRVIPDNTPGIYGVTVDEARELVPEGLTPAYVPHRTRATPASVGGGNRDTAIQPGKTSLQKNKGVNFTQGRVDWNPAILASEAQRRIYIDQLGRSIEALTEVGVEMPAREAAAKGWVAVSADTIPGFQKFSKQADAYLESFKGVLPDDELASLRGMLDSWVARNITDPDGKVLDGMVRAVPPDVFKQVSREFRAQRNFIIRATDNLTDVFRFVVLPLRPAWYVSNLVGNAVLYSLSAKGPGAIKALAHSSMIQGKRSHRAAVAWMKRTYNSPEYLGSWERALAEASGLRASALGRAEMRAMRSTGARKRRTRMVQALLAIPDRLGDLNAFLTDDLFRQARFIELMQKEVRAAKRLPDYKGLADGDVALKLLKDNPALQKRVVQQTLDDLVDFRNLTNAEREIMRRVFPFYSWSKGMAKWSVEAFWNNPERVWAINTAGHVGEAEYGDFWDELPSFEKGAIPIGPEKDGVQRRISPRSLNPFQTVGELADMAMDGTTRGNMLAGGGSIGSMVNPIIKGAGEALTGQDAFTQMPVSSYGKSFDFDDPEGTTPGSVPGRFAAQVGKATTPFYNLGLQYARRDEPRHGLYRSPFEDYALSYLLANVRNVDLANAREKRKREDEGAGWQWRLAYG